MNTIMLAAFDVNPKLLSIPIAAIFIVIAVSLIIRFVATRYVKVGPDEIAVFSGRKYKFKAADGSTQTRGFFILQGGGKILLPIVEKVEIIKIAAFQVEVGETNIPNADSVGVDIKGVATCRLSTAEEDLGNAVTNFLNKTPEERLEFIQNILKGHVRSITGNLTIDQLLRERQKLNEQVIKESTPECKRIGIEVINLVIQDVRDQLGYIASLGKQKVAEALRDSEIAVALANKETAVKTSGAQREAAEATAQNEAKIAEAKKDRDVKIAEFSQQTEAKRAIAETAFAIAKAEQDQKLKVAEADRDGAEKQAQTRVQELEALRRTKELEATQITKAQADQRSAVINAEAAKQVAELNASTARIKAEGDKNAMIQTGEGEAQKKKIVATAEAEATRATLTAKADGDKAVLLAKAEGDKANLLAQAAGEQARLAATAEGTRLQLNAQAEGKQKQLLAEAEGTEKLAEALQKLSEQGKLILILDRLPGLLDHGGEAGAKIAKAIFEPIAEGVSKIGNVTITDLGGGDTAKTGIAAIGGLVPQILTDFLAQLKLRGVDVSKLMDLIKVNPQGLMGMIGALVPPTAPTAAPAASSPAPSEPKA